MRKHDVRCENAKSKKCVCSCRGERHNPKNQTVDIWQVEGNGRIEVWKKNRTALDDEPAFALLPNPPTEIRAWRNNREGQIGLACTNVPQRYAWHSPGGFEWGYGGSGPADFALNVLALFVDPGTARLLHQDFKWDFIATLPPEGGLIQAEIIQEWIQTKKAEMKGNSCGG